MKASVIIAFYNKIHYLKLVLAGFERQTNKDFEILLADDGSGAQARAEIDNLRMTLEFPIRHIWHEDLGWRKNVILNKAIQHARTEYLIFVDGDCIPHRHFIKEHLRNRETGKILSGRRVNLSREISDQLNPSMVKQGFLEKNTFIWLWKGIKGDFTHAEKGLYLPLFRSLLIKKQKDLLGSNFSLHKQDMFSINGFDERYLAPTVGEDTDIEYRAGQAGIRIKSIRNLAIQYHLYHTKLNRDNHNYLILEDTITKGIGYTPYGIIQ